MQLFYHYIFNFYRYIQISTREKQACLYSINSFKSRNPKQGKTYHFSSPILYIKNIKHINNNIIVTRYGKIGISRSNLFILSHFKTLKNISSLTLLQYYHPRMVPIGPRELPRHRLDRFDFLRSHTCSIFSEWTLSSYQAKLFQFSCAFPSDQLFNQTLYG